ncbi:MAG: mevalonate kinase family protein [Bacillota bacterium]
MKVSIPGKLYITGEYGVIEGGHAILAPVRRHMHFDIRPASIDRVASKMLGVRNLSSLGVPSNIYKPYVMALKYLESQNIVKKPFLLTIQSELDTDRFKLGLGSSGALSVGIIKAILVFHGLNPSPMTLFKLSVLTQYDLNKQTSFGDLSVHAYSQWVLYRKVDERWLQKHVNDPLTRLIKRPWKDLKIVPFAPPSIYGFAVNSTKPSSSISLVESYKNQVSLKDRKALKAFMNFKTQLFYKSLRHVPKVKILDDIHDKMHQFSHKQNLSVITEPIETLVKTLRSFEGEAKFSGAGGGDCVIAFFDTQKDAVQAKQHFMATPYPIIEIGGVKSE